MNPFIERLGWTLLHSLWQGAVAWIALEISLAALRRGRAQARYLAGCGALAFFVLAPWVTFFSLDLGARLQARENQAASTLAFPAQGSALNETRPVSFNQEVTLPAATHSSPGPTETRTALRDAFRPFLPWIVRGWAVGSVWYWLRLAMGWRATRRLAGADLGPLPVAITDSFRTLCARMQLRRVIRLGDSLLVQVPTVVGWWCPVILWPAGVSAGLSAAQIEALLAHEIAHVVRHDFAANLVQAICEALFFYHPAIHAINRHIRREREHACDDAAVAATRERLGYALALASLESARVPSLAMAATGDGDLLNRIRRIMGVPPPVRTANALIPPTLLGAVLYLAAMFALPAVTAQVMTSRERIAAIHAAAPETSLIFQNGDTMLISGELRTPDGSLANYDGPMHGSVRSRTTVAAWYELSVTIHQGRFTQKIPAGEYYIRDWPAGFAPIVAGPFRPAPITREVPPISLTVTPGHSVRVAFADSDGNPIVGVHVEGWASSAQESQQGSHVIRNWVSDERGEIAPGNIAADARLELFASQPGYQDEARTFQRIDGDRPLVWKLSPAVPTACRVVDAESSQQLAGVQVQLASRQGADERGAFNQDSDRSDSVLATSDAEGRFILSSLNPDWVYKVYLKSPDHEITYQSVTSGMTKEFRLGRGFRVAGRVRGPAAGEVKVQCEFYLTGALRFQESGRSEQSILLPVATHEQAFAFDHIPAGRVSVTIGAHVLALELHSDQTDLVFDLTKEPSRELRAVNFVLKTPSGEAPPAGAMTVSYRHNEGHPDFPPQRGERIVAVGEKLTVTTPNEIELRPGRLIGYWFASRKIKVEAGAKPLEVPIEVSSAGAIQGRFLEPDASLARNAFFACFVVNQSPAMSKNDYSLGSEVIAREGTFTVTPLPFGGRYLVVAYGPQRYNFAVSSPILVDADHPFPNVELKRQPGISVLVRLLDDNERPVMGEQVSFAYSPGSGSVGPGGGLTNPQGEYTFEGVNFDVPGYYVVMVGPNSTWQSQVVRLTEKTPLPLVIRLKRKP